MKSIDRHHKVKGIAISTHRVISISVIFSKIDRELLRTYIDYQRRRVYCIFYLISGQHEKKHLQECEIDVRSMTSHCCIQNNRRTCKTKMRGVYAVHQLSIRSSKIISTLISLFHHSPHFKRIISQ